MDVAVLARFDARRVAPETTACVATAITVFAATALVVKTGNRSSSPFAA